MVVFYLLMSIKVIGFIQFIGRLVFDGCFLPSAAVSSASHVDKRASHEQQAQIASHDISWNQTLDSIVWNRTELSELVRGFFEPSQPRRIISGLRRQKTECGGSGGVIIIIIIINPLIARVVGAPRMVLQPVFSIFPRSSLPSGTCRTPGMWWRWGGGEGSIYRTHQPNPNFWRGIGR